MQQFDQRRREVLELHLPREAENQLLGWYTREQAWKRPLRDAMQAVFGGRGRVPGGASTRRTDVRAAVPWAPLTAPVTASARRYSAHLAREVQHAASRVRTEVLGDGAELSARAAGAVLETWVEDGWTWNQWTAAPLALRYVTQPRVARFLRHYWRRSGELWSPGVLMEALLRGAECTPRTLPPLVAHPRAWVQPLHGGRALEAPPHHAFEIMVIDPDAGQAAVLALWRRMRPRGRGRPRSGDADAWLRALVHAAGSPVDWVAEARRFNAQSGGRVSPDALRMRWARLSPSSRGG